MSKELDELLDLCLTLIFISALTCFYKNRPDVFMK